MKVLSATSSCVLTFESMVASGLGVYPRGTGFLAAVSGGADSTAMLAALAVLRQERDYKLYCLHVEHGIRPAVESRGDARAVVDLCKRLDVPCRVISIAHGKIAETAKQSGLGIEGTARFFRHRAWRREARRLGVDRILVAHTKDDLLETVLMRFLRGSGPAGLAAMPRQKGKIVRPLVTLTRDEIVQYLASRGIPFRTDSTNEDIRYMRNRIRHSLIPCLDTLFPHWRKALMSMAETQRLTAHFLSAEARTRVSWEKSETGVLRTEREAFFSQPGVIREEAVFQGTDMLAKYVRKWTRRTLQEHEPDADVPDLADSIPKVPRRTTVRLFTQGQAGSLDAGPIRIEHQGHFVTLSSIIKVKRRNWYDAGFALLIKEPGVYTLKTLRIECTAPLTRRDVSVPQTEEQTGDPKHGFFAYLPVVFRSSYRDARITGLDSAGFSGYTSTIIVEDMQGPVAYILSNKKDCAILLHREEEAFGPSSCLSFVLISGGIDGE